MYNLLSNFNDGITQKSRLRKRRPNQLYKKRVINTCIVQA